MRKSVVIAVLILIPVSFAQAQVSTEERDALIALYNSTNGATWSDNTGWLGAAGTECTWNGVICFGPYLAFLMLFDNQLNGSIPPELGNLPNLTYLGLFDNQLSGAIPPELGDLSNLEQLYLFGNQLDGSIPPELGDLSSLTSLKLNDNQLSGSIPPELGKLSNLEVLYLHDNQLNGSIPLELGNLSSLLELHLYENQLAGSIPSELGKLSSLQQLDLDSNQLSGSIPPELGNLSSLEILSLRTNQLNGSIPSDLGDLSSLQQLDLISNQLSGNIPAELGMLSSLETLNLGANQLSGSIPPELGDLSSLTTLKLYANRLSGSVPAELESLTMLELAGGLSLLWNALHSDNASLISFLDSRQWGGDWQKWQTIAPVNLSVDSLGNHTVWLSWDAVSYQLNPGGYEVFSSPAGSGIWTSGGWTESKTTTTYPVTGLDPGVSYDLAVVTYTDPHTYNLNLVNSDFSTQEMATTASTGCAQPVIEKTGTGPFTLSLTESYDSYRWSDGGIASSILVDPSSERWYWVTVTGGSCEETAAISVVPILPGIFADGFESGDTTAWSSAVP